MRSLVRSATRGVVSAVILVALHGCDSGAPGRNETGSAGSPGNAGSPGTAGSSPSVAGSGGPAGTTGAAGSTAGAGDTSGAGSPVGTAGYSGSAGRTGQAGSAGQVDASGGAGRDAGAGGPSDAAPATDGPVASPELEAACTLMTATFMNQMPASGGGAIFNAQVPDPPSLMKRIGKQDCLVLYDDVATLKKISAITLVIESPGSGVAATGGGRTGFSAAYIAGIRGDVLFEIEGVISHEFTHIYQNNRGPGWMIEGMADFVRYKAGYFKLTSRRKGGNYDGSYQTTGFFLAWLDTQYPNFGRKLNQAMKTGADVSTFMTLTGKPVTELWTEYQAAIP